MGAGIKLHTLSPPASKKKFSRLQAQGLTSTKSLLVSKPQKGSWRCISQHFRGRGRANGGVSVCYLRCGFQLERWLMLLLLGLVAPLSSCPSGPDTCPQPFGIQSPPFPLGADRAFSRPGPKACACKRSGSGSARVCAFSLGIFRLVTRNTSLGTAVALRLPQGKTNRLK